MSIAATVNWLKGDATPTVSPDTISVPATDRDVTIIWSCGENVASFQIQGLTPSEFAFTLDSSPAGTVQITDTNDDAILYSYTVVATHTSGQKGRHDPRIQNGST